MKNKKIVSEAMGGYSQQNYPATSMAPRKDFVPYSKTGTYNYPYQSNNDSFLPSSPVPPNPPSMPWELNFIVDDLADSYVYLQSAINKIAMCYKNSLVLKKDQKKKLYEYYKFAKKANNVIKKIGYNIENISNISHQPTPDLMNPISGRTMKRN